MVSVCLPSDASHNTYCLIGFSYLGHGVSLHGCSSKAQLLLLTLNEVYLLTAAPPNLEHGATPRARSSGFTGAGGPRGATPHSEGLRPKISYN